MFSKFRSIDLSTALRYARNMSTGKMISSASVTSDFPALVDCRQGEKTGSLFSKTEMERRLSKLRETMVANSVDVCVFTSYHNIAYYSEYFYVAFGRPYGLVVTMDNQTSISASMIFLIFNYSILTCNIYFFIFAYVNDCTSNVL